MLIIRRPIDRAGLYLSLTMQDGATAVTMDVNILAADPELKAVLAPALNFMRANNFCAVRIQGATMMGIPGDICSRLGVPVAEQSASEPVPGHPMS